MKATGIVLAGMAGVAGLLIAKFKTPAGSTVLPGPWQPGPSGTSTSFFTKSGSALTRLTGNPDFGKVGDDLDKLFGQGKAQARDLVREYQDPLVYNYFARLSTAWNSAVANHTATADLKEQMKSLIRAAANQFYAIASQPQFSRAGPGGIATIRNFVEGTFIPSIDASYTGA